MRPSTARTQKYLHSVFFQEVFSGTWQKVPRNFFQRERFHYKTLHFLRAYGKTIASFEIIQSLFGGDP